MVISSTTEQNGHNFVLADWTSTVSGCISSICRHFTGNAETTETKRIWSASRKHIRFATLTLFS